MDPPNLGWIGQSREFAKADSLKWMDAVVGQVAELRALLAPKMVQTNAAGYSGRDFAERIGVAAGSVHLELMNLATQGQTAVWPVVEHYMSHDTYVDFVGAETWTDMLNPKWLTKFPGGNYALPVYRAKVQQLANYYMLVPADGDVSRFGLQIDNVRLTLTPDSVDLPIYRYDVGRPTGARAVWLDTKDALGQTARVYRRDFDHATILMRAVTTYRDTVFTDTTAVPVPLPAGGPWDMVTPYGQLRPLDSLRLRLSESVILRKR